MSIESFFRFISADENEEYIKNDINELLSSNEWSTFISSISDNIHIKNSKSNISLISILQDIYKGLLDQNYPYIKYDPLILVESFVKQNCVQFLSHSLSLCAQEGNPAFSFVESLILHENQLLMKMNIQKQLSQSEINALANITFRIGFIKQERNLMLFLLSLGLTTTLDVIFGNLSTNNDQYCYKLISQVFKYTKDFDILKKHSDSAILTRNELNLNFILDFLIKNGDKDFNYQDAFQKLFEDSSSTFLVDVLVSRATMTPPSILQAQIDILNQKYIGPLRAAAQKLAPRQTISDEQLRQYATYFQQKNQIPPFLCQLSIMDRTAMSEEVGPSLQRLGQTSDACLLLYNEMKRQKLVPKPKENPLFILKKQDGPFETLINTLEEYCIKGRPFAADLLDSLNCAIYTRHKNDLKQFMSVIETKLLNQLSTKVLLSLAESVSNYMQTDLSQQHLFTLCVIASRLPMTSFIKNIFSSNANTEVTLLSTLHDAAIASSNLIKLTETPYVIEPSRMNPNASLPSVASLDRIVMLRYRWRSLRGDAIGFVSSLPEYQKLITDDPMQFLEWELNEPLPIERSDIIKKLNIRPTSEALFLLLKAKKPNSFCLSSLVPLFSGFHDVMVPAEPNIKVIMDMGPTLLWNEKVLNNPFYHKSLRKCKIDFAKILLQYLPQNYEYFFDKYPSIFACIISNIPPIVVDITQPYYNILNDGAICSSGLFSEASAETFPKSFIYAVSFILFRSKLSFPENIEWKEAELFFSILNKEYDRAFKILNVYTDLCYLLLKGCPYEGILCDKGEFLFNLVHFAVHCSQLDIFIDSELWIQFINQVLLVTWPDEITTDSELLVIYHNYIDNITHH